MIDVRMTEHLEAGATIKPRFSTEIVRQDGGGTVKNSRWSYPLHTIEFNLSPGIIGEDDDLEDLRDLFYAAGGSHQTFRFKDRYDYRATAQPIGTGDGNETEFQLFKTYTRAAVSRTRKIVLPVQGTVVIYKDGVVVPSATVDYSTGLVTISPAPASGAITADFEFDIPVSFADDEIELAGLTGDLQQPVNITLEEERE